MAYIRKYLSKKLVLLATKLYPDNPLVVEFNAKLVKEALISGLSITNLKYKGLYR